MTDTPEARPRVGLLAPNISDRPDLLTIAGLLRPDFEMIVLTNEPMERSMPDGVPLTMVSGSNPTLRNRILQRVYGVLGRKPRPTRHHRAYLRRRLGKLDGGRLRRVRRWAHVTLTSSVPGWWSYTSFLRRYEVSPEAKALVGNLDSLLVVSDPVSDDVLAAATQAELPMGLYVYSWDHPAKYHRYPDTEFAAVWSDALGRDLTSLQGRREGRVEPIGASQHAPLVDAASHPGRCQEVVKALRLPDRLLTIMASYAYPHLAEIEAHLIEALVAALRASDPGVSILFKGYPNLQDKSLYRGITSQPGVIDHDDVVARAGLGDSDRADVRAAVVCASMAVAHLGTTVGIEAAVLGTPSIYVDVHCGVDPSFGLGGRRAGRRLARASQQYHLQEHYAAGPWPAVVRTVEEFIDAVGRAETSPDEFLLSDGQRLRELSGTASSQCVAARLGAALHTLHPTRPRGAFAHHAN